MNKVELKFNKENINNPLIIVNDIPQGGITNINIDIKESQSIPIVTLKLQKYDSKEIIIFEECILSVI